MSEHTAATVCSPHVSAIALGGTDALL